HHAADVAGHRPGASHRALRGDHAARWHLARLVRHHVPARRRRGRAGRSSIAYRVPGRPTLILSWPEITRVRARDVLQRLDLADVTGTRRIVLAYQMENFARLRQIIRERTTPAARTGSPQRVFAKSLGDSAAPALAGGFRDRC